MKKIFTLFLLINLGYYTSAQTPLTEALDFTAKTIHGETIHLFEYLESGKIVVIDFFSTSCGPCAEYAPDIQASHEDFGSNEGNVVFLGICWGDNDEGVAYFDSVHGITFPSVSCFDGGGNQIMGMYQVQSYPTVVLIAPDGTIKNQYIWEPTTENINNDVIAAGGILTGINNSKISAAGMQMKIFPLPAKDRAALEFKLERPGKYAVKIFDLPGNEVLVIPDSYFTAGLHTVEIDITGLSSGLYLAGLLENSRLIVSNRLIVAN